MERLLLTPWRNSASGRMDEGRLLTCGAQKKRLNSFSQSLSLALHHPFSAVRQGEKGGPLCWVERNLILASRGWN